MAFTPRLIRPNYLTNPYYRHTGYNGGLNECIIINNQTGEVMPNCVGYAWGRAYEIMGLRPTLSKGNAPDWYDYHDGYERGTTPKVGSIICWAGDGIIGRGHVGVVEEVDMVNREITVSNSAYGGGETLYFYLSHLSMDTHYAFLNYTFQGFIYLPFDPTPPRPKKKMPLIYYARNVRR